MSFSGNHRRKNLVTEVLLTNLLQKADYVGDAKATRMTEVLELNQALMERNLTTPTIEKPNNDAGKLENKRPVFL